ncbi:uncharacterized protein LOC118438963 [Folsomia candida]|uniref:uncharacterized protein LOC118438963 n=1 Tax=Folsomia candida TaxID=158441 RepID=UPI001604D470|nr:uncharacterized protein LOC118438963 [Folsomia candida]
MAEHFQSRKGTGNLLKDLLSSVVLVKKCDYYVPANKDNKKLKISTHQNLKGATSSEILCCFICASSGVGEKINFLTEVELEILKNVVLSGSAEKKLFQDVEKSVEICETCSSTLQKLVELRTKILEISICLRTVIKRRMEKIEDEPLGSNTFGSEVKDDLANKHVDSNLELKQEIEDVEESKVECGSVVGSDEYKFTPVDDNLRRETKVTTCYFSRGTRDLENNRPVKSAVSIPLIKCEKREVVVEEEHGQVSSRSRNDVAVELNCHDTSLSTPQNTDTHLFNPKTSNPPTFSQSEENIWQDRHENPEESQSCKKTAASSRRNNSNPTSCSECGKWFENISRLNRHLKNPWLDIAESRSSKVRKRKSQTSDDISFSKKTNNFNSRLRTSRALALERIQSWARKSYDKNYDSEGEEVSEYENSSIASDSSDTISETWDSDSDNVGFGLGDVHKFRHAKIARKTV